MKMLSFFLSNAWKQNTLTKSELVLLSLVASERSSLLKKKKNAMRGFFSELISKKRHGRKHSNFSRNEAI